MTGPLDDENGMTLRSKIIGYFVAFHVVLGAVAAVVLIESPLLLFIAEGLFLLSVAISIYLVRALFVPLDLIRTGSELIAERDFTSRFVPVGQPEMDRLIDVYNRMIDRLREERLLAEEQHQLLEKIVEASPAGIVLCDFEGNIERMNPSAARMLGGAGVASHVDTELASLAPGESRLITRAGSRRIRITRGAFRDRGYAKSFFLTEELTEELRLGEKAAYEKLIRMMSHEVNNSVGAVRSLLESVLRYAPQVSDADRADFGSAITIASARVDSLNRFMSSFADVVRIPLPHPAPTSIAELVERVAALFAPELSERKILLETELTDRRDYEADVNQLEQVVVNLLRNAIEAVEREGSIRIAMTDGVLIVADSGPGISEDIRRELFTPFFTTRRDGRGLGLTIVQEILANHGFPFSLENRAAGGAEFRIVLGERVDRSVS
jgi:two-component system, NtrC family, nitrogen regulation sensor histidine kinase NtrY